MKRIVKRLAQRLRPRRSADQVDYVFVVTFGRSGSTLVQGLLNTLPRTVVRGENAFFLKGLFESSEAATTFAARHAKHNPVKRTSAFYGVRMLQAETFARHSRALVTEMLYGRLEPETIDRIGFKEVLWHLVEPEETERFFAWFDQVFPGARFVLNTRDPLVSVDSGFWKKHDRDDALAKMERVVEIQDWLEQRWPERVFRTRYETITGSDLAARDAMLSDLATFVTGSCDDELLGAMRATLDVGHGPLPFGISRRASGAGSTVGG